MCTFNKEDWEELAQMTEVNSFSSNHKQLVCELKF